MTMPSLTPNWSRPIPAVSWPWPDPNRKTAPTTIPVMLDEGATLPARQTSGAAGFDLTARCWMILPPHGTALVPTGVHIAIPAKHHADVRGRSGLAARGYWCHVGLIDSDYRGELGVILHNLTDEPHEIHAGDRIGQLVFPALADVHLVQVDALDQTERGTGAFGSTGRA